MIKILALAAVSLLVAAPAFAENLTAAAQGKMLVDAAGARLAVIDRVDADGSADILLDGHVVKVPGATLSMNNGKVITSLKKSEVASLR